MLTTKPIMSCENSRIKEEVSSCSNEIRDEDNYFPKKEMFSDNCRSITYSTDPCESQVKSACTRNAGLNYESCYERNGLQYSLSIDVPESNKPSDKKCALFIVPPSKEMTTSDSSTLTNSEEQPNKSKSRPSSYSRAQTARATQWGSQLREQPWARQEKNSSVPSIKTITPFNRPNPIKGKQLKPDSLPCSPSVPTNFHKQARRTASVTRARTPGTPSDDGRWPSVCGKGISMKHVTPVAQDLMSVKIRGSNITSVDKCPAAINPYGTLPRRRKQKSHEDLTGRRSRSSSISKENVMTVSVAMAPRKNLAVNHRENTPARDRPTQTTIKNTRRSVTKTKIYHEISVQTAITSQDVEKVFSKSILSMPVNVVVEHANKSIQCDLRDKEFEEMQMELTRLTNREIERTLKLNDQARKLSHMDLLLKREKEEKIMIQKEMNMNAERVFGMLEIAQGTLLEEGQCDSLLLLETQIQMSGHELLEKQEEIGRLRKLCRTLKTEMECLIQEKISTEKESNEMQDFLQHEKISLSDAFKEIELEYQLAKKVLKDKDEEIKVLQDECRHLVRLNEQRRLLVSKQIF